MKKVNFKLIICSHGPQTNTQIGECTKWTLCDIFHLFSFEWEVCLKTVWCGPHKLVSPFVQHSFTWTIFSLDMCVRANFSSRRFQNKTSLCLWQALSHNNWWEIILCLGNHFRDHHDENGGKAILCRRKKSCINNDAVCSFRGNLTWIFFLPVKLFYYKSQFNEVVSLKAMCCSSWPLVIKILGKD